MDSKDDGGLPPCSRPVKNHNESPGMELVFATVGASAIPAGIAYALMLVLPAGDPRVTAGTAFTAFGLACHMMVKRSLTPSLVASHAASDRPWLWRHHLAWLLASAITCLSGLFYLIIVMSTSHAWRYGFSSFETFMLALFACALTLMIVGGWMGMRIWHATKSMPLRDFWSGYHNDDGMLSFTWRQVAGLALATMIAVTAPAAACVWTALKLLQ